MEYGDLLLPNGKILIREAYKTKAVTEWKRPPESFLPPLPIEEINKTRPIGLKIYFNVPNFWNHCSVNKWDSKHLVPGYYIFNSRGSLFRSVTFDGHHQDWICVRDQTIPKLIQHVNLDTGEQFTTISPDSGKLPNWRPVCEEDNLPSWIVEVDDHRL